jgi:20S proteasome subunit alpha 7
MVDPAGVIWGYFGAATGKARQAAKTEIEKLDLANMDARTAVIEAAKIIHKVHDSAKDKLFELELGWICADSQNAFQMVPAELFQHAQDEAIKAVKEAEEADDEDEDEDEEAQ